MSSTKLRSGIRISGMPRRGGNYGTSFVPVGKKANRRNKTSQSGGSVRMEGRGRNRKITTSHSNNIVTRKSNSRYDDEEDDTEYRRSSISTKTSLQTRSFKEKLQREANAKRNIVTKSNMKKNKVVTKQSPPKEDEMNRIENRKRRFERSGSKKLMAQQPPQKKTMFTTRRNKDLRNKIQKSEGKSNNNDEDSQSSNSNNNEEHEQRQKKMEPRDDENRYAIPPTNQQLIERQKKTSPKQPPSKPKPLPRKQQILNQIRAQQPTKPALSTSTNSLPHHSTSRLSSTNVVHIETGHQPSKARVATATAAGSLYPRSNRNRYLKHQPIEEDDDSEEELSSEGSEESEEGGFGPKFKVKAQDSGGLVLIRNLPKEVTSRDLVFELFDSVAGVDQISIQTDPSTGASTGVADVSFFSISEARDCVSDLRDCLYRGQELKLTLIGTSSMVRQPKNNVVLKTRKKRKSRKRKKTRAQNNHVAVKQEQRSSNTLVEEEHLLHQQQPPPHQHNNQVSPQHPPSPTHRDHLQQPSETTNNATSNEPEMVEEVLVPIQLLKTITPTCVKPETRPWNWGKRYNRPERYEEEYAAPDWTANNDVLYHVTMKKPIEEFDL